MRDWRAQLAAVAREPFVPETIWLGTEDGYAALRRSENPAAWHQHVAADEPIVTQVDDGTTAPGQFGRVASSSTSQPSVVALMLDAARLRPGLRVLEIGTGTGWNTALLCARLGEGAVVSVEVDPEVARSAAAALADTGYHPVLAVADGARGHPDQAPYDRVLATVAVIGPVPHCWIAQTGVGGLVVTPWGSEFCNGALLRLRVDAPGHAHGHFHENVAFIRLRGLRSDTEVDEAGGTVTTTALREAQVHEATSIRGAGFPVGLRVPDCRLLVEADEDGCAHRLRLSDPATSSWARVHIGGTPPFPVHQGGPRALWDEVESAYRWWCATGRPPTNSFGLTVSPTAQLVWLGGPDNVIASI